MRVLKIFITVLIITGLVAVAAGCGSGSTVEDEPESQLVAVERGNLTVEVTSVGNLALSLKEDIAFETGGYVEAVLVEAGDTVQEGQVLASLDTTSLTRTVRIAEQSVRTAEIDLEKVTNSYRKITYPYDYRTFQFDVPEAMARLTDAERNVNAAVEAMHELGMSREQYSWQQYWEVWDELTEAQDELALARAALIRGEGQDVFQQGIVPLSDYWTLRAAQLDMEKYQVALEKAIDALDIAMEEMGKAVVVASFEGFVTVVNVEGGDEVMKGTVAVQLADPSKFEADILVSELDIMQIRLGGEAWVEVDAMTGMSLSAEVTHISPTATIQSSVVNYQVKVQLQSLEELTQERQAARQEIADSIAQGEIPERLRQAIEEGQITQEQAEAMISQMQQTQAGQQSQVPVLSTENVQLREGLTVTVNLVVDERTDVLLIPNQAITYRGTEAYVEVAADGTTAERAITTGISDWQYTEVTSGLSEGEQVVVPEGTVVTAATSQQGPHGGMFVMGGPAR